ncbi:MAG: LPS export ABC transporter periplasmic protein LptC [Candidatus Obscuribacterales bacterium]|nr:LPS export ABC transporter periplasmic protein LptC [Candidatus Obscuribacterales bacterium]
MPAASFSIHSNWFRNAVKLVAALSIPAGIVWFFIYSQEQARIEVENYQKEQKANPTSEGMVVNDYQLKEVDDYNHVRWQLVAKKGSMAPNNRDVLLDSVIVEYFDGPNVKMRISAPKGEANQETRYVKLISADNKKVETMGDGGKSKFEASIVELIKKNQFIASGGVIIEWSEVAKVTGNTASGNIDSSGISNVKVAGNTHSTVVVK